MLDIAQFCLQKFVRKYQLGTMHINHFLLLP